MKQALNLALRGDYRHLRLLLTDQIPKLQEFEAKRAEAQKLEEPSLNGCGDLLSASFGVMLDSGALPDKYLAILLRAAVEARITPARLQEAFNLKNVPMLPPSTPPAVVEHAPVDLRPEDDPPF